MNNSYEYVFFDLDGTLTDSGLGITNCVMYALEKFNIRVKDRSELFSFIGPPLKDSFIRQFGFSESDSIRAVDYYRERYSTIGLFENEVYDGIREVLEELIKRGKKLVLATSKPEFFAVQILEHFELAKYFFVMAGAAMNETRLEKWEVIEYAINQLPTKDTSTMIMVGDRSHDVIGAARKGIETIGVLFGYGSEEELRKAGARYIAATPADILDFIP